MNKEFAGKPMFVVVLGLLTGLTAVAIAISLPADTLAQLERIRKSSGKTRSALIKEAVEHWLRTRDIGPDEMRYIRGYLRHPEGVDGAAGVAADVVAGWDDWT